MLNMPTENPSIQVLLPVYNEEESIENVIREIYDELSKSLSVQFIICEDGSKDNTKNILKKLSQTIPMKLILSDARKGYSRAVIDGLQQVSTDYAAAFDSDGQYTPKDFWRLYEKRLACDVCIGWRKNREDTLIRKLASNFFKIFYQFLFRVPIHDPSCPLLLISKPVLTKILNDLGTLKEGFWWEFIARTHSRGFTIHEVPIEHRKRFAGNTQVYKFSKMPRIFISHLLGIICIWKDIQKNKPK